MLSHTTPHYTTHHTEITLHTTLPATHRTPLTEDAIPNTNHTHSTPTQHCMRQRQSTVPYGRQPYGLLQQQTRPLFEQPPQPGTGRDGETHQQQRSRARDTSEVINNADSDSGSDADFENCYLWGMILLGTAFLFFDMILCYVLLFHLIFSHSSYLFYFIVAASQRRMLGNHG